MLCQTACYPETRVLAPVLLLPGYVLLVIRHHRASFLTTHKNWNATVRTSSTKHCCSVVFFLLNPSAPTKHLLGTKLWLAKFLRTRSTPEEKNGIELWNVCHATTRVTTASPKPTLTTMLAPSKSYLPSVLSTKSRNQNLSCSSSLLIIQQNASRAATQHDFRFIINTPINFSLLMPRLIKHIKTEPSSLDLSPCAIKEESYAPDKATF